MTGQPGTVGPVRTGGPGDDQRGAGPGLKDECRRLTSQDDQMMRMTKVTGPEGG